jgi:hypothetical protein
MLLDFDDCSFEGSPGPTSDRRHCQRQSGGLQAHLYPDLRDAQESDELEVVSLNLSRYGVGLELAHDVPVGSVFNIEIGSEGQTVQSQVRIVSCDPIADGLYRAGGEFC